MEKCAPRPNGGSNHKAGNGFVLQILRPFQKNIFNVLSVFVVELFRKMNVPAEKGIGSRQGKNYVVANFKDCI